jgi:hypothetical protein
MARPEISTFEDRLKSKLNKYENHRYCNFSKPDPPPAPDYARAAKAQGAANVDTARLEGRMNNPNVYTPWGSQEITFGAPREFDSQAYLEKYPGVAAFQRGPEAHYNEYGRDEGREASYTGGPGGDQATITQSLSPSQQRIFDLDQNLQIGLLEAGQNQLNQVSGTFNTPWDTSGAPQVDAYNPNQVDDLGRLNLEGMQNYGQYDPSQLRDFEQYDPNALNNVRGLNQQGLTNVDDATVGGADRIMEAMRERYQPEFDERRTLKENQLLTQGHGRGGAAWETANRDLGQQENDFRLASMLRAGQEQSRMLGEQRANRGQEFGERTQMSDFDIARQNQLWGQQGDVVRQAAAQRGQEFGEQGANIANLNAIRAQQFGERAGQFQSDAQRQAAQINQQQAAQQATGADRGRYIQEQAYDRNVPLNETNALRQGNQVQPFSYQGYQPTSVQPAPLFDATLAGGNFAQQNFQTKSQQYGDFWGGVGDLGIAAATLKASDRRAKENILPVKSINGLMSYLFNYIGNDNQYLGYMADEVKEIYPNDVISINGYDHVTSRFAPVRV